MAEDVAQSAFMQLVEKIGGFDERRPFAPWFHRIVIHAALRAAYRARRDLSLEDTEDRPVPPSWLVDPASGPEDLADTHETRQAVWQALQQLTPRQRAVTVMHYFLEMPDKEISREMDSPLTAIKWSLYAARERLRRLLQPFSPVERPLADPPATQLKRRNKP